MKKTYEEKIRESQEKIEREKAKQKRWIAAENARKRKERNARIYAIGAHAESIMGAPTGYISMEDHKEHIGRLIRIGLAAEEVFGQEVDPSVFKYFLLNQEERGKYFSRFLEQRKAGKLEPLNSNS